MTNDGATPGDVDRVLAEPLPDGVRILTTKELLDRVENELEMEWTPATADLLYQLAEPIQDRMVMHAIGGCDYGRLWFNLLQERPDLRERMTEMVGQLALEKLLDERKEERS